MSVGVLVPLWSVASIVPSVAEEDDSDVEIAESPLGDFRSALDFLSWLESCNFKRWMLLPIGPGRIDARLAKFRSVLTDWTPFFFEDELDVALKQLLYRDVSADEGLKMVCPGELFYLDHCPYLPSSAFGVNPMWFDDSECLSANPRSGRLLNSLNRIFENAFESSLGDIEDEHELAIFERKANWTRQWIRKHVTLSIEFHRVDNQVKDLVYVTLGAMHDPVPPHDESEDNTGLALDEEVEEKGYNPSCHPEEGRVFSEQAFMSWMEIESSWAMAYAAYEAIIDFLARDTSTGTEVSFSPSWTEWPDEYQLKEDTMFTQIREWVRTKRGFLESLSFHLYCQFMLQSQLNDLVVAANNKGIDLFGDIPFYVPMESCDCWSRPNVFGIAPDNREPAFLSGLPPDFWSEKGQIWGTPTYAWDDHPEDVKCWWYARFRRSLSIWNGVRIDHFRAFGDFWAIPRAWSMIADADTSIIDYKTTGAWKEGPGWSFFEDFQEKNRFCGDLSQRIIVEDLGEKTELFERLRSQNRFPRIDILHFNLSSMAKGEKSDVFNQESAKINDLSSSSTIDENIKTDTNLLHEHVDNINTKVVDDDEDAAISKKKQLSPLVMFIGSHDDPTLREWLTGIDEETRRFLGNLTGMGRVLLKSEIAGTRFLLEWVMQELKDKEIDSFIPLQDILQLDSSGRINIPGQNSPALWTWKLDSKSVETLRRSDTINWIRTHISK